MNFFKSILYIFLLTATIMSCDLEKQIDLDIPEAPKELVIECYLEPGKPLLALVLETQDFFDTLGTSLPIVTDATVVISHNGQLDTLAFGGYLDGDKVYNYGKPAVIVAEDYNTEYTLTVTDPTGRKATGTTKVLPPVPLDSITYNFLSDSSAIVLTYNQDDPNVSNFYRRLTHRTETIVDSLKLDFTIDDNITSDGQTIVGGPPIFNVNDTLIVSLYHISEEYHDFIITREESVNSNGNPFATPGIIVSNIDGGIGIFTGFSKDRQQVILE